MHFEKYQINCRCLDAGEVVLLRDAPETLKYKIYLIDSDIYSYTRAQRLRDRVSDSRLREARFESCAAVLNIGQIVSLYIAPVY